MSDDKRETVARFDVHATDYLASEVHRQGADLDQMAWWCAGARRALDVATGAGHTAGALRRHGVESVVATDAAPEMVATAVETFDVAGVVADAERLPFADRSFDAVTCRIAAHHFPDPVSFVAEVERVLVSDGVFAFEDNVAPDDPALATFIDTVERCRDPSHVGLDTPETWIRRFEACGFEVMAIVPITRRLDFDAWCSRMDVSTATKQLLREEFANPPPGAASAFDFVFEDGEEGDGGEIDSFVVPKRLFRLRP